MQKKLKNNEIEFTTREKKDLEEIRLLIELDQIAVELLKIRGFDLKDESDSNFTSVYDSTSGKVSLTYVFRGVDDRKL